MRRVALYLCVVVLLKRHLLWIALDQLTVDDGLIVDACFIYQHVSDMARCTIRYAVFGVLLVRATAYDTRMRKQPTKLVLAAMNVTTPSQ